jgi:phosphatidylglycerophosphatase C
MPMNLALFDFDGTITKTETFTGFLHYAADPKRKILGRILLGPSLVAYKLGVCSPSTMRKQVVAVAFRGKPEAEVRQTGLRYCDDIIPGMIRRRALKQIAWHKAQGDRVVVVSASLDVYLAAWCQRHDLECICTELEARNGILTGRYLLGDCTGQEKSRRILARYDLRDYAMVYAYGDTEDDRPMLELAHRRYFRWREEGQSSTPRG